MLDRQTVLDRYFLDCRCQALEIAATLDRFERAPASPQAEADPRRALLREALRVLAALSPAPDRTERLLRLFSDPVE